MISLYLGADTTLVYADALNGDQLEILVQRDHLQEWRPFCGGHVLLDHPGKRAQFFNTVAGLGNTQIIGEATYTSAVKDWKCVHLHGRRLNAILGKDKGQLFTLLDRLA